MSGPVNAVTSETGRFYVHPGDGSKYFSVTTILKALSKPALVPWAAKEAALCADREWAKLSTMKSAERIARIKGASGRIGARSSAKGSQIHGIVEEWILAGCPEGWDISQASRHESLVKWNEGGELLITKAELVPYFDGFVLWCAKHEPKFIHSETTVFNRTEKYAGTLDLIAELPHYQLPGEKEKGCFAIIDLKSGNSVYPEVGPQLAAYARGEFYLKDGVETPLPPVEAGFVLHVQPGVSHMIPVLIDDEVFDSFKYCREMYRFQVDIAKRVLGAEVA